MAPVKRLKRKFRTMKRRILGATLGIDDHNRSKQKAEFRVRMEDLMP
jgi:hypothetical protein